MTTSAARMCPMHGRAYPCPVCVSGPHFPPMQVVKPAIEAWEFSLIRIAVALESIATSLAAPPPSTETGEP